MSVIIAAWNGPAALRPCLGSLTTQLDVTRDEIIIVSNFESDIQDLLSTFAFVKHVTLTAHTDVPRLRSCGIELARGEIVASLEDHCIVDDPWSAAMNNPHHLPYPT